MASIYENNALYVLKHMYKLFFRTWQVGGNSLGRKYLLLQWHCPSPTKWQGSMLSPRVGNPPLVTDIPRDQIWSLLHTSSYSPFLLAYYILIMYYNSDLLHPRASSLHLLTPRSQPWWQVSEPELKNTSTRLLTWIKCFRVFWGSKSTIIFENVGLWQRASQCISKPYKGGFYASGNFLFLANLTWRYFPIWTSYKFAEKAVCLGCKVWAPIPSRWELSCLTRSIQKPFGYVKSCENDFDW